MTAIARQPAALRWRPSRPSLKATRLVVSAVIFLAIVAVAALAPVVSPYDPTRIDLSNPLVAPQWFGGGHVLGTDQIGRDLLSRMIYGIKNSLVIGIVVVMLSGVVGTVLGLVGGIVQGITEAIIMRLVDLQMSVPGLVLVIFLAFMIGPGLWTTIIVLGVIGWVPYTRIIRSEMLVVAEQQYVLAARSVGASPARVIFKHALPQAVPSFIVLSTLQFGVAIVVEASVSFLGFGIQPPGSSLGLLISDGRAHMTTAPWMLFAPAAVLFVLVLLVNFIGDELNEWLDPVRRRA